MSEQTWQPLPVKLHPSQLLLQLVAAVMPQTLAAHPHGEKPVLEMEHVAPHLLVELAVWKAEEAVVGVHATAPRQRW